MEDFLNIDEQTKFCTETIAKFINKKRMKNKTSVLIDPWDCFHRIFVSHISEILETVNNKFSEIKEQISIPMAEPHVFYSEEEIESMIVDNLRIIKEHAEMEGILYTSEQEAKEKTRLEDLYTFVNRKYGKNEKVLQQWTDFVQSVDSKYRNHIRNKTIEK
jgi:hypothetical protein